MEQILELEEADDITSIRSRIDIAFPPPPLTTQKTGRAKKGRLLLIVPRKNRALQTLVNMKLLARLAKIKAVEMAIVSDHPVVRDYAKEAEVKAFGSLKKARRAGWITEKIPVVPSSNSMPPIAPVTEEEKAAPLQPSKKRVKEKKRYNVIQGSGRIGILQQLGALILLVILASALTLGAIILLPRADVTLTPIAQPVEANLIVKADPAAELVDFDTLTFPARVTQVDLDLASEIETVNTKLAPVGRAEGLVTFVNRTEQEQTIPISVTLSTSAGEQIDFITTVTTTIPAGINVTTKTYVIATKPGPKGNVGIAQINRFIDPSYALLSRVINEKPLISGTMEATKVVVNDDKERLQAHLRQKIQQEGLKQLQDLLGEQEFIPPETLQVIVLEVTYSQFSGDFSDSFGGEMQAVVRGTVVGGYNANRLALVALEAQVPPNFELDIEGLHFGAGETLDIEGQTVTFKIFASGKAIRVINNNQVAESIAGLSIGEAQAKLSRQYDLASVPGVELKPAWLVDWLGRLPYIPIRINIIVNDSVLGGG